MKRKLFYPLFSLVLVFLLLPISSNRYHVYAGVQDCSTIAGGSVNFEFIPFPVTTDNNSINLKISNLNAGDYQLWVSGHGDNRYKFNIASANGSYEIPEPIYSRQENFTKGDGVDVLLFVDLASHGGGLAGVCGDLVRVTDSGNPPPPSNNCKLKMGKLIDMPDGNPGKLKPTVPIYFHIEGDIGGDPNTKRGVQFHDSLTGANDPSTCKTNAELAEGVPLTNRYSQFYPSGDYTLKVYQQCTIFDTPETSGDFLCESLPVNINPDGGGEGPGVEKKVKGSTCLTASECPQDSAQYCVDDKTAPGHKVCSNIQPIQHKCKNGECETAIGSIGYTPAKFSKSVISLILSLAGGILLIFIIISGYRIMVSQGDPEKVKEARESVTAAVVGLLFIIFSLVILQFITVDVLHIPGFKP